MNKDLGRVIQNFISLLLTQGGNYIVPLITLPYLVSVLGVTEYGKYSYALVFNGYFLILSSFGFNLSAPKIVAENSENTGKLNEIFSSVLTLKILLIFVSLPILLTLLYFIPSLREIQFLVIVSFGFVIAQALTPNWFFQGMERMKLITITSLSAKTAYAISLFVLVREPNDLYLVPVLNSSSYLITAIIGLLICVQKFQISYFVPSLFLLKKYLIDSYAFFLSRVSVSLYTISNTFVVGAFLGMEMVGVYSIAEKLFQAMQGLYHPLMNAVYPFISRVKDNKIFRKIFLGSVLINFLVVVGVYFTADIIFSLVFRDAGIESVFVFQRLLFITLVIVPSILLGYPFLGAMGFSGFVNRSVMISSFLHITLLVVLIILKEVTLMNVVLAIFITESTVLLIRIYGTFKFGLWSK
ncbi:MAG: oligosaccharide flippase family protein [Cyclobacteriaceae bacterium]